MNKVFYSLLALAITYSTALGQTRYIDKVFDNVERIADVKYGTNISIEKIVTEGATEPSPQDLFMDIYHPAGDSVANRPVVILAHAGDYLPQYVNTSPIGTRGDSAVVEFCKELAQRGYVAVSMDYRLGWNPFGSELQIKETVLQATYRTSQDMQNAVRFMRKTVAEDGNPYGISGDHFALGGLDAAAWSANNVAYLKEHSQLLLPKFLDLGEMPARPFIIEEVHGNPAGTNEAVLNIPNYPDYSSEIDVVINWLGGVGNFDWIEAGDVPTINFERAGQFGSGGIRDVTITATGSIIIAEGAFPDTVSFRANELGNNDVFKGIDDELGQAGRDSTGGLEGIYIYDREVMNGRVQCVNTTGVDSVGYGGNTYPWNWYNEDVFRAVYSAFPLDAVLTADEYICRYNTSQGNPNDPEASRAVIRTLSEFMAPRIYAAMGLGETTNVINLSANQVGLKLFPNPSAQHLQVRADEKITRLDVVDMRGRIVLSREINSDNISLVTQEMPQGMYILRSQFDKGVVTSKFSVQH